MVFPWPQDNEDPSKKAPGTPPEEDPAPVFDEVTNAVEGDPAPALEEVVEAPEGQEPVPTPKISYCYQFADDKKIGSKKAKKKSRKDQNKVNKELVVFGIPPKEIVEIENPSKDKNVKRRRPVKPRIVTGLQTQKRSKNQAFLHRTAKWDKMFIYSRYL